MDLKMWRPISVKREHPADQMIPDVSTATGTNSKSATSQQLTVTLLLAHPALKHARLNFTFFTADICAKNCER